MSDDIEDAIKEDCDCCIFGARNVLAAEVARLRTALTASQERVKELDRRADDAGRLKDDAIRTMKEIVGYKASEGHLMMAVAASFLARQSPASPSAEPGRCEACLRVEGDQHSDDCQLYHGRVCTVAPAPAKDPSCDCAEKGIGPCYGQLLSCKRRKPAHPGEGGL